MKFAALFGLAAFAAAAVSATVPAFASEDDEPARVSRDWNGGSKGTTARGSAPNQRGSTRTNTVTRDTSTHDTSTYDEDEPKVTYARPNRNNDNDNDGDGGYSNYRNKRQNGHRGHHEYGGLDPSEAARIRHAHRESDRRVTLDRDYHDYGVPSYRSHSRRRHWWSMWW